MGISTTQKQVTTAICACGCGAEFEPFPIYGNARTRKNPGDYIVIRSPKGTALYVPKYIRGHHPNARINQSKIAGWNSGLTKADHPSIERMGFRPGHPNYSASLANFHQRIAADADYKAQWLDSKRGQIPWNKGLSRDTYPNGIATGSLHGNWKGGHRGLMDTAEWQRIRQVILHRDNFTCQECGDHNHKGRGKRIRLEVHHVQAIKDSPELTLESGNLITLCTTCHRKTHNYGSKALVKRSGN